MVSIAIQDIKKTKAGRGRSWFYTYCGSNNIQYRQSVKTASSVLMPPIQFSEKSLTLLLSQLEVSFKNKFSLCVLQFSSAVVQCHTA